MLSSVFPLKYLCLGWQPLWQKLNLYKEREAQTSRKTQPKGSLFPLGAPPPITWWASSGGGGKAPFLPGVARTQQLRGCGWRPVDCKVMGVDPVPCWL